MKYFKQLISLVIMVAMNGCSSQNKLDRKADERMVTGDVAEWLSMPGNGQRPTVVLVSGDEEYRSEEAMPQLARILSRRHGFDCTVLFAQDPKEPGIVNPNHLNHIPGLEKLKSADLMILFTRFRALPDEQMKSIDDYLKSGKPVIGIRTSTHAFSFPAGDFESAYRHYGNSYKGDDAWDGGFGRLVLGEKWISHHGDHKNQSTKGMIAAGAEGHPILNGISNGDIWGPSDVYGVRLPLPGDAMPLINGQVTDRKGEYDGHDILFGMRPADDVPAKPVVRKNSKGEETVIDLHDPVMPIAWIKTYQLPGGKKGRVFTSTIGSSVDLLAEGTRRLLVNAVYWSLEMDVPAKAAVGLAGDYHPTQFSFLPDSVWKTRKIKISSLK